MAATPFDGKCHNLEMSPTNFALALTLSEIYNFYLQKVGQGHEV